jgi:predicted ATPase
MFHAVGGDMRTAQALAAECLQLAEQTNEAGLLLQAHWVVGAIFLWRGELVRARASLEQSVALYQPQHRTLTPLYGGYNPQVASLGHLAWALWLLGYPEQALTRVHEALHLAQELAHPLSLVVALGFVSAWVHLERGEGHVAQERADEEVVLSSEHGFPFYLALGTIQRGAALIAQGQRAEGVVQIRQGLEGYAGGVFKTGHLAWLARGYEGAEQVEDGLATVAEALQRVEKNDERFYEAEVYRIKGELTLQSQVASRKSQVEEAEACFLKAIGIAQKQQAKSLELRAVMSLARLWQSQGKHAEAHRMLSDVYNWFTEGFDTKDLQEAKARLDELSD